MHVTTTYAVRSDKDGSQQYKIALSEREQEKTHFIEAKVKGQFEVLPVESVGYDAERYAWTRIRYRASADDI